jgi:hypothetical protein
MVTPHAKQLPLHPDWFQRQTGNMPSIFRFVLISAALAGLAYGAVYALATLLEPSPRDVTVTVPPAKYAK